MKFIFCKGWHEAIQCAAAGKPAASHAEDSDDEGDLVWQGITSSDAAQPSSSIAAANGNSAVHAISLAAAKSLSAHTIPAESSGVEVSANEAAGTSAPVIIHSSRAGQDRLQSEAKEQRCQNVEESGSKAPGWTSSWLP